MSLVRTLSLTLVASSLALTSLAPATAAPTPRPAPVSEARKLTFNGRAATAADLQIIARLEATWGVRVPDGAYWYDNVSGAGGLWGGPTRGFLGAGLGLGGHTTTVPANASGGGQGITTGVFINGREIHPLDYQGLAQLFGQAPWPGHWWVDGQGNFGQAGGPMLGNLVALVQQRQRAQGGSSYYKSDISQGKSTFVGSGCAAVTQRKDPTDRDSSYSYYVGCE